ncbi:MAG: TetR/AcrR family transcriptional regulator [Candidatus Dadabacteria bacterium]|nr:MAG: TetR/AcrR family transcriptional regulator [Candidatus Dadabacteria bacterium]
MVHVSPELSPRRRRRRQARTEEILATAERLLERGGLEAVTIHAIAAELDWAQGALYRYFPSKDALLASLQRRVLDRLGERIATALAQAGDDGPPLGPVMVVAETYRSFATDEVPSFNLLTQSIADPREWIEPGASAGVVDAAEGLLGQLRDALAAAAVAGVIEDGPHGLRAVQLWAAMHGVLQLRKIARLRPQVFPIDQLATATVDDLLSGWGASRDDCNAARDWARIQIEGCSAASGGSP